MDRKTVLITGINRGIGRALALLFAEKGYEVIGTCRSSDQGPSSDNLTVETLDIRDDGAITSLAKKYEGTPIDILINNAGILYAETGSAWQESPVRIGSFSRTDIMKTIDVNTVGTLMVTEAFTPHLLRSREKLIVTVSSHAGSIENSSRGVGGFMAYRISKAALNMGMQEFAGELKNRGVRVLLLHPGWVRTDMGGKNAAIDTDTSARGLIDVIEHKDRFPTGGFYDYEGHKLPF
ncbi:MAG: SDR family oxidoreductase [Simkaniaceae bacterium]|nr:SDR family oxidoreductase [Simkaniaceae bacterium]